MNKFHKTVAKLALIVVVWLLISLIAPWALSAADTLTNIAGALLVVVPGYVTVFIALPRIFKSFFVETKPKTVEEKA